jgi:hypothetical protein
LLATRLQLCKWQVVGVLECLFQFTAVYAKRGDIGKWSNAEIASAMEWEGSSDELIQALIDTRWLDISPTYRLLVHDWKDHADQTVCRSEDIKKLGFASNQLADAGEKLNDASQPSPRLASPRLAVAIPSLAIPKPSPSPSTGNGELADADDDGGDDDIWERTKTRAINIRNDLGCQKAKPQLRRKIAACCLLVEQRVFPVRWITEAVNAAKDNATDDAWGYLWKCLRSEATAMKKNLEELVATIDLPADF